MREPKIVVTGHRDDGTAVVISDQAPRTYPHPKFFTTFYEIWNEQRVPVTVRKHMQD